ncbi:MAG: ispA [Chlamydiales bacterium]|jgi:geranylgeranyl diphosphate synthase type II|nr:ispA [Chlamydiales bacterium]
MSFAEMLRDYKNKFESFLSADIQTWGEKNPLLGPCEYALLNGGKRFRPAIVMMIAEALGNQLDVSKAAIAVECFHCASLIADDLPCMDDDDFRRDKPSLHKAYDEATALLASYSLISKGYEYIYINGQELKRNSSFSKTSDERALLAIENATFNTGIQGIQTGQYLDLYPTENTLNMLLEVFHKKTVTLFEVSFVFGWLFGGGQIDKLNLVKRAAYSFGMAFQLADDIDDLKQDLAKGRSMNFAIMLGVEEAFKRFGDEVGSFKTNLKELGIISNKLDGMMELLVQQTMLKINQI